MVECIAVDSLLIFLFLKLPLYMSSSRIIHTQFSSIVIISFLNEYDRHSEKNINVRNRTKLNGISFYKVYDVFELVRSLRSAIILLQSYDFI